MFAVLAFAGCANNDSTDSGRSGLTPCQKDPNKDVCVRDFGPAKDTSPMAANDLGKIVQNPDAWKDGQECLDWTVIQPPELIYGMSSGCNCWKPPYCWCPSPGGRITAACNSDHTLCCNFFSTCIPCGWEAMSEEEKKARHWIADGSSNTQECKELLGKLKINVSAEMRVCHKWK